MLISRLALMRGFLCAPAGDDPAGGGGADGSGKPAMTEEQIGAMVNGAVEGKLRKLLPSAMTEAISSLKLEEKIAEAVAKVAPKPPDDTGKDKKPAESELEKQIRTLAKNLEDEKAARVVAETAKQQAEERQRFDGARQSLRTALKEKANEDYLDDWVDRLSVLEKRLSFGEDGAPLLKVRRVPFPGAPEGDEEMPLADAVKVLLARPEAKKYLAVPSPRADGRGGPKGNGAGNRAPALDSTNPAERARALAAAQGFDLDDALASSG